MGLRAALEGERFPDSFNGSPVYAQFSSMGSLDSKWLYDEFQSSLCAGKTSGEAAKNPFFTKAHHLHAWRVGGGC